MDIPSLEQYLSEAVRSAERADYSSRTALKYGQPDLVREYNALYEQESAKIATARIVLDAFGHELEYVENTAGQRIAVKIRRRAIIN